MIPLVLVNPLLCFAFSMFISWIVWWYISASQNGSATRRLLISSLLYPPPSGLRVLEQILECFPSVIRQVWLGKLKLQLLPFFHLLSSFLRISVNAPTKISNTWNIRVFIRYWEKIRIWGHYFYQNKVLNEYNWWTNHTVLPQNYRCH